MISVEVLQLSLQRQTFDERANQVVQEPKLDLIEEDRQFAQVREEEALKHKVAQRYD